MRVAFDTSVLVAALLEAHPRHERAVLWVDAVTAGRFEGLVAWHGLAEVWAVLTRLPGALSVPAATGHRMVQRVATRLVPLAMEPEDYEMALERCADRGLRSGAVFDALHLAVAERAGAEAFLTFDPDDFERLAVEGGPRVVLPPDPPALQGV